MRVVSTVKSDLTRASASPVFGDQLSDHRNSLNFLRLVLASVVLLSHAASLVSRGPWAGVVNQTSAAQIALYGFFAISGYLIAQSAAWHTHGHQTLRLLGLRLLRLLRPAEPEVTGHR